MTARQSAAASSDFNDGHLGGIKWDDAEVVGRCGRATARRLAFIRRARTAASRLKPSSLTLDMELRASDDLAREQIK